MLEANPEDVAEDHHSAHWESRLNAINEYPHCHKQILEQDWCMYWIGSSLY